MQTLPSLTSLAETPHGAGSVLPGTADAVVADCFARVLGLENLSADEDFFEAGGDSVAAVELALRLNEALAIRMPMTAAFDAPTIRTLTELCRRYDGRGTPTPMLLKPGIGTPIFLAPGASGIGAGLRRLGLALEVKNPVHGFDYPGLDGHGAPLDQVADLAEYLLPSLTAACPEGRCILGGYSVGGLVAYEMACRLAALGRAPALLLLIDSPIARIHYGWDDLGRIWRRRAAQHWHVVRTLGIRKAFGYSAKRAPAIFRDIVPRKSGLVVHEGSVSDAGALAARRYNPPRYEGRTVLLWSKAEAEFNALDIVWRQRAASLTVVPVPGTHASALTTHLTDTAAALSLTLHDAA